MNIAIIEDEVHLQEHLVSQLKAWSKSSDSALEIETFNTGNDFIKTANRKSFQIVFMDIYLNNESGIDTALEYRKLDINSLLIFLTSSKNHMRQAFPCRAFDYLLKPVDDEKLFHTLDEAMRTFKPQELSIELKKGDLSYSISYGEIRYVYSQKNYCLIQCEEAMNFRMTFAAISEELLKDSRFCLINRGVLVNLDYVDSFDSGDCLMNDGNKLPLNTKRFNQLNQLLIDYRFRKRDNNLRRM